jgi:ribosome-binding protein aMBF1 (putative translation factor)
MIRKILLPAIITPGERGDNPNVLHENLYQVHSLNHTENRNENDGRTAARKCMGQQGETRMTTWTEMREELTITELEELLVEREKTIIKDMVRIREEQGLSQAQLGRLCKVKQPVIARMEKSVHSPQLSSILKILEPMGYTLKIVPAQTDEN